MPVPPAVRTSFERNDNHYGASRPVAEDLEVRGIRHGRDIALRQEHVSDADAPGGTALSSEVNFGLDADLGKLSHSGVDRGGGAAAM